VGLGGCLPHANVITLALAPVFSSCLHPDLLAPVTGSPVSDICRSCRLICQLSRRPKLRPLPPANHPGTQLAPHPNPRPSIQNPESRTHRNQTWASSSTGTASFYACWVNSCLPTTASSAFPSPPIVQYLTHGKKLWVNIRKNGRLLIGSFEMGYFPICF